VAFVVLLPLVLLASAAVAELSWRLVEQPALRLRARRQPREQHAPLAPEATRTPIPAGATTP
jgi:peptidoglycan/LPS O-acetylase OafA/YrhL